MPEQARVSDVQGAPATSTKRRRTRTIVVATLILGVAAAVGVGIYLAAKYTRSSDGPTSQHETETEDDACDDVAVVGAGIAGTYSAWRLRKRELAVTVYEFSGRVGGRLHTEHFPGAPDINVELGGMRFVPRMHPLINKTSHELGLPVVDFAPGVGFGGEGMVYLRRRHMKRRDLGDGNLPYNLKSLEKHKTPPLIAWELLLNETNYNASQSLTETDALHLETKDGVELYQQSIAAAYDKMGSSSEATRLIRDSFGYYSYYGDVSAAIRVPARDPNQPSREVFSVKTIRTGMNELPTSLLQQFLESSERHKFKPNHRLVAITRRTADSGYTLRFQHTKTVDGSVMSEASYSERCARKVVLAVPRLALETIQWTGLEDPVIQDYVRNAVKDAPAAKIFLAYDRPWWRFTALNFSHSLSDLPNRQTYDFGSSAVSNTSVLIAAYMDMGDVKFWREVQKRGKLELGAQDKAHSVSEEVVQHAHRYLAELYNVSESDIPRPVGGMMALWDQYPYGAGWHVWMPGYIWRDVQDRMVRPSSEDNVFIASSSFFHTDNSAWSENALELVEQMLNVFDK